MNLLAQGTTNGTPLGPIGGSGLGPFGAIGSTLDSSATSGVSALRYVTVIVSSVIGIMTVAAGIWFIFQFLIGGFFWISSGGDKNKLHDARERITNAAVGLLITVAGWGILALAGQFLGYDIVISEPRAVIESLNIRL